MLTPSAYHVLFPKVRAQSRRAHNLSFVCVCVCVCFNYNKFMECVQITKVITAYTILPLLSSLNKHFLNYCKPLVNFQSTEKLFLMIFASVLIAFLEECFF